MQENRKNLSSTVEDSLFQMIVVEQKFPPGEKLPNENVLSQTLGVSRTTLREALRSLAMQGILEIKRGKGTYISTNTWVTNDDFGFKSLERIRIRLKDLFELRLMFEPETAFLACERGTDAEIDDIIRLGEIEEDIVNKGEDRTEADQLFHRAIVMASHNEFLIRMIPIINNAVHMAIASTSDHPELLGYTLQDHRQIMDFFKARDAKGAKYAMTIHLHHAMRFLNIVD